MIHRSHRLGLTAIAALAVGACAAPVKEQEQSGFLSDYSRLEQVDDQTFVYVDEALAGYRRFIIEPVAVLYRPGPEDSVFTEDELEDLKAYFVNELTEALTDDDGYEVVDEPGPGVARLRYAITHLDDTIGALNLTIYTKITGAGLGGAAIEGEAVDSESGEQFAATLRWGSGSRILRAGFTRTGDAKILLARWSKDLRKRLDAVNGRDD